MRSPLNGPIVVTGASGLLGANLCLDLAARGSSVTGVFSSHAIHAGEFGTVALDLTLPESTEALCELSPSLIIHCAAATDVDRCEREPEWARLLNVTATLHVAWAARRCGALLVHISTDAVFPGDRPGWRETDQPAPVNEYGRSKLEAEGEALRTAEDALVVRTVMYGWNAQRKSSLAEWALARLEAGEEVPGFIDAYFTPILANDLGDSIMDLVGLGARGVLHVCGTERVSKYDFARAVARTFGLDESLVHPVRLADASLHAPRAVDLSLDCSTAIALGVRLPDLSEGLARFATLRRDGYSGRLRALT